MFFIGISKITEIQILQADGQVKYNFSQNPNRAFYGLSQANSKIHMILQRFRNNRNMPEK